MDGRSCAVDNVVGRRVKGTALDFIYFVLHLRRGQKLVYETGYIPLY